MNINLKVQVQLLAHARYSLLHYCIVYTNRGTSGNLLLSRGLCLYIEMFRKTRRVEKGRLQMVCVCLGAVRLVKNDIYTLKNTFNVKIEDY